ncbi:MAG: hypothetical protein M0009_03540 [Deltaproteobacteria bacterium]|nr:hypothetical protein [Deltaproteobacteria bacterium]
MAICFSLFVFTLVFGTAGSAGADGCPPNNGYVSCCIGTDGTGCGTSQVVSWTTSTTGDWKRKVEYCYPQDVNWCKNNMTGNRSHLVNTICNFSATGYNTNGGGSDKRCCRLSPGGC